MQEGFYDEGVNYRHGSPHLQHHHLRDRLVERLRRAVQGLHARGMPLRVLEIGAGHGGYTEPLLALGAAVTAVEMSLPSVQRLEHDFGVNEDFTSIYDPHGDLADVGDGFSLILAASVLHHIPDYLSFLSEACGKLRPGGEIVTIQDPLWYDRVPRPVHVAGRLTYMAWRVPQGNLGTGVRSVMRRWRNAYDETQPGDMVEYHVVREGVDERAIEELLAPRFAHVDVFPYWSTYFGVAQRMGERLGWANTFGIHASDYRG